VGGCPKEEEGQPGNQMMHHSERGRSQIIPRLFVMCISTSLLSDMVIPISNSLFLCRTLGYSSKSPKNDRTSCTPGISLG
jgi:hypothetical protein